MLASIGGADYINRMRAFSERRALYGAQSSSIGGNVADRRADPMRRRRLIIDSRAAFIVNEAYAPPHFPAGRIFIVDTVSSLKQILLAKSVSRHRCNIGDEVPALTPSHQNSGGSTRQVKEPGTCCARQASARRSWRASTYSSCRCQAMKVMSPGPFERA